MSVFLRSAYEAATSRRALPTLSAAIVLWQIGQCQSSTGGKRPSLWTE